MGKFCTNCGSKLDDKADVCLNCGVMVNKTDTTNPTTGCEKSANTGFILGLISIIAWFIPLFGYPVTICGIVNSAKGLKSNEAKTKAIIGLVLSIIFLIVTLINSILGVIYNVSQL